MALQMIAKQRKTLLLLLPAALLTITLYAVPAFAGDAAATSDSTADDLSFLDNKTGQMPSSQLPDMGTTAVRMVVTTIILLGLLIGGLALFNRYARNRINLGGGQRPLRVLDRVQLSPKKSVCILNACGRHLLLGVGEHEITLLLEFDLPENTAADSFDKTLGQATDSSSVTGERG